MKTLIISVLFLVYSLNLFSQDTISHKRTIIKADIFSPVVDILTKINGSSITVFIERFIKDRHSFQLKGSFGWSNQNGYKNSGVAIIPCYKYYYFQRKINSGAYVGAYTGFSKSHLKSITGLTDVYFYDYSAGGIIGYQFYNQKNISFDFLIGIGILRNLYTKVIVPESFNRYKYNLLDISVGISIGYIFL